MSTRFGWALLLMLLLGACSGGYPPQDEVTLNPATLPQPERLKAMNALGQKAHTGSEWSYALAPGCRLAVRPRPVEAGREAFELPLQGQRVHVRHIEDSAAYEVLVHRAGSDPAGGALVFLGATHFDAALMRGLVIGVQDGCRTQQATAGKTP